MLCFVLFCFVCRLVCGPVGVEDMTKIPDARMTASTYYNIKYYPYYGRLNKNRGLGAWCAKAKTDRTDYLQVDMGAVHSVCAVATQGIQRFFAWTISYKVLFSTDGVVWNSYKENTLEKVTSIKYSRAGEALYKDIMKLSEKTGNFWRA